MSRSRSENHARFSAKMSFLLPRIMSMTRMSSLVDVPANLFALTQSGDAARRKQTASHVSVCARCPRRLGASEFFFIDFHEHVGDDGARCSRPKRVGRFWLNSGLTCCQAAGIWPVNWHPTGGVHIAAHPAIHSITLSKGYYFCGNTTSSFGHQFAS
jgi:hypothetical protein